MKNAILSILKGTGDSLSSKRVALFIFIFAFLAECGLAYVKLTLPDTLRDELFYTMQGLILAVFGEGAIAVVKGLKEKIAPADTEAKP